MTLFMQFNIIKPCGDFKWILHYREMKQCVYLNMLECYTIALFISKVPTQRNKKNLSLHIPKCNLKSNHRDRQKWKSRQMAIFKCGLRIEFRNVYIPAHDNACMLTYIFLQ